MLCLLPLICGSAFGWGCEGHQMVGLIARAHLTAEASAAVDKLLADNPLDPAQRRFCRDRPTDPIADSASWADDMKSQDKTFTWHFVDIPLAAERKDVPNGDLSKWCEEVGPSVDGKDRPGCLTSAIAYEWGILRDKSRPGADRARAMRYLIHFYGDLTQPLHDSDNHDQGGNCTRISFFGGERLENLHGIWDDRLLAREVTQRKLNQIEYAKGIDKEFIGKWKAWGESKTDINGWAWEGHEIARSVTYGKLTPPIPVADPALGQTDREGCNVERAKVEGLHVKIAAEYAAAAVPVIRQQLAKSGYRLAGLLNQGF